MLNPFSYLHQNEVVKNLYFVDWMHKYNLELDNSVHDHKSFFHEQYEYYDRVNTLARQNHLYGLIIISVSQDINSLWKEYR